MLMAGLERLGQRMAGKAEKPAEQNLVVTPAQANREMVMADAVQNQPHGRRSSSPSARRKALSGRTREGSACVAIGGLWNWETARPPIAGLDPRGLYERPAIIGPD